MISDLRGLGPVFQTTAPAAGQPPAWMQLVPMLAIFAIFYFLLIAPTRKRQKKHQEMINALQKGDEVVTSGGLHGTIMAVQERVVLLRIADEVKVKVDKSAIAGLASEPEAPKD